MTGPTVVPLPDPDRLAGAIEGYRRNLDALMEFNRLQVTVRADLFKHYQQQGFSREEALSLVITQIAAESRPAP